LLKFDINVFINYSVKDEGIVEKIERELSHYPFLKTFRAPKDIIGGAIWEKEIKNKITQCDIMLAILTENYYDSEWPVQEIGVAWMSNKPILPISFKDTPPRGYIKNFQVKNFTYPLNYMEINNIAQMLLPDTEYPEQIIDELIEHRLSLSKGWKESNAIGNTIKRYIERFSVEQTNRVIGILNQNSEVSNAAFWRDEITKLLNNKPNLFNVETQDDVDNLSNILAEV